MSFQEKKLTEYLTFKIRLAGGVDVPQIHETPYSVLVIAGAEVRWSSVSSGGIKKSTMLSQDRFHIKLAFSMDDGFKVKWQGFTKGCLSDCVLELFTAFLLHQIYINAVKPDIRRIYWTY